MGIREFNLYIVNFGIGMKISLVCGAVFISVVSASYQSRPLSFRYGSTHRGTGGHGGGIDPLTLLLLQKDGDKGGKDGINNLLPLLLAGGGMGGKGGHAVNPLLFAFLGGKGDSSGGKNLLPLLLSGGLGGKKGGISTLLLTSLIDNKCVEEYSGTGSGGCTQPTTSNADEQNLVGKILGPVAFFHVVLVQTLWSQADL